MSRASGPSQARPARPADAASDKRASQVADRIVEDVMALGWPVGSVLGSEAELLDRYRVSRAVFREAVRLVEHREVARTRRGPGGGLVVTEPSSGAVVDAVVFYLQRVDAPLDEVFEARILLEEIASELACARIGDDGVESLRDFVDRSSAAHGGDPRVLHEQVARASGNPAIELFVHVLNQVAQLYTSGWRAWGLEAEIAHAHSRIAEAVMARDAETARRRMRIHLQAEADYLKRRRSTRQLLPESTLADHAATGKLGEAVARAMARGIVTAGLSPGDAIGNEADLMERHGVSRAALREAVRLLEYHGVARMKRGPGGGLFVLPPDAGAVTDMAAIHLARIGMDLGQLGELRAAVEVSIVRLAIERLTPQHRDSIEASLERESSTDEVIPDFHTALAAAASNRVLELLALVLIRLTTLSLGQKLSERLQVDRHRAHSKIARAVLSGDGEEAQRRMRRHLEGPGRKGY